MNFRGKISEENQVKAAFAVAGSIALIFMTGWKTSILLLLFLSMTTVTMYMLSNLYEVLFKKSKAKFRILMLQFPLSIIIGSILYFEYGLYALLKPLSISCVLTIVIIAMSSFGILGNNKQSK